MHSSRMRTVSAAVAVFPGGEGGVCSRGVSALGGVCSQEVSAPGGGGSVVSQHALRQTPPRADRHTPCKKHNLHNFVADGKN